MSDDVLINRRSKHEKSLTPVDRQRSIFFLDYIFYDVGPEDLMKILTDQGYLLVCTQIFRHRGRMVRIDEKK